MIGSDVGPTSCHSAGFTSGLEIPSKNSRPYNIQLMVYTFSVSVHIFSKFALFHFSHQDCIISFSPLGLLPSIVRSGSAERISGCR